MNTDDYSSVSKDDPLNIELALSFIPRAFKRKEIKKSRSKSKAEIYTPIWLTNKMIDLVLEQDDFQVKEEFLTKTFLEITCGEAPFLVQRYDSENGEEIELKDRHGLLDLKMKVVNQISRTKRQWIMNTITAYQTVYAYELVADSLFLARQNMFLSLFDYAEEFGIEPDGELQEIIAYIISFNIIQLDGLKEDWLYKFIDWKEDG